MKDLEQSLAQLKHIEPDAHFVAEAKQNVLYRIGAGADELAVEAWFDQAAMARPRSTFLQQSKMRVMNQAAQQEPRWMKRLMNLKRFAVSTFILTLAVFGTVFMFPTSLDTTAVAADSPLLEVLTPEVKIQKKDLSWKKINDWLQLKEGDLLSTSGEGVDATLHFGDIQARPDAETVLLLTRLKTGEVKLDVSQGGLWINAPAQRPQDGFISLDAGEVNVLVSQGTAHIQANTLKKEASIQVFSGLARVTYPDPITGEIQVDVLSSGEQLQLQGQKSTLNIQPFDIEVAKQDPSVQRNLQRDLEQLEGLKDLNVVRLKNVFLGEEKE